MNKTSKGKDGRKNNPKNFKEVSKDEYLKFLKEWKGKPFEKSVITICEPPLLTVYLDDAESHFNCTWIAKVEMDWMNKDGKYTEGDENYIYYIRL